MDNTEKESPIYEEPKFLEDILKKLLTKTEYFLMKAGVDMEYWEKMKQKEPGGLYLHSNHIYGFSDKRLPKLVEGYTEIIFSLEMLKFIVEAYEKNGADQISLSFKDENHPLIFYHNGIDVWGSLSPRIPWDEDDE